MLYLYATLGETILPGEDTVSGSISFKPHWCLAPTAHQDFLLVTAVQADQKADTHLHQKYSQCFHVL